MCYTFLTDPRKPFIIKIHWLMVTTKLRINIYYYQPACWALSYYMDLTRCGVMLWNGINCGSLGPSNKKFVKSSQIWNNTVIELHGEPQELDTVLHVIIGIYTMPLTLLKCKVKSAKVYNIRWMNIFNYKQILLSLHFLYIKTWNKILHHYHISFFNDFLFLN